MAVESGEGPEELAALAQVRAGEKAGKTCRDAATSMDALLQHPADMMQLQAASNACTGGTRHAGTAYTSTCRRHSTYSHT